MSNEDITAVTITRESSSPSFSVSYIFHAASGGDTVPQTISASTAEGLVRRLETVIGRSFNYHLWQLSPKAIDEFRNLVNAAPGTKLHLERNSSLHYIQQRQM